MKYQKVLDDQSRCTKVYLLRNKSEASYEVNSYELKVENYLEKEIKILILFITSMGGS